MVLPIINTKKMTIQISLNHNALWSFEVCLFVSMYVYLNDLYGLFIFFIFMLFIFHYIGAFNFYLAIL